MNEYAAKLAIKNLISDNESILVDSLEFNGVNKEIETITVSTYTPPKSYYHIIVYSYGYRFEPTTTTTRVSTIQQPIYDMIITVVDAIEADYVLDDALYETNDKYMMLFTDRIVQLLLDTEYIETSDIKLKIIQSSVEKANREITWEYGETNYKGLITDIIFEAMGC